MNSLTRDNSNIWIVKITDTLSKEEYNNVSEQFKAIQGYYSRFKRGFLFKYDPTETLKSNEEQEQEQREATTVTMENTDDILSKFDEVIIENTDRISQEDKEFCEEKEKQYNQFIEFSNNYIKYLKDNVFNNEIFYSGDLISEMNKEREIKKDNFINKIVGYFRDKYKVTLKGDTICKKYNIEIDYNTVVTEIIEQLGGYSFVEKAEKEIKDEFKHSIRYEKVKIKNSKISIDSFFYIDQWDLKYKKYTVAYNSDEKFYKLFKALSHFLYKVNDNLFDVLYSIITREENDKVFTTHEIANSGVKTLKVYKNGKIDLEFSSMEYARKFAREYCGYMEQSA